uniref:Ig-like domain-containing protein n=1 Tax=Podarcis muralis TaxID=64176 RepID=A0A670K2C0_PODMU
KSNPSRVLTMVWALSFLPFSPKGVISQPSVTQPASESVSPGQTAKLFCTASGSATMYWYQQKPGQVPRYLHCDGCSSRGPGIPNRFTASRSGTAGHLSIANLEREDEAVYYCAVWLSSSFHCSKFLWGTATKTSLPL